MTTMIYADHAATTPMDPRVWDAMEPLVRLPLNASSVHRHGQRARAILEELREEVAEMLALPPTSVLFTSGATESNNLAIRGFCDSVGSPRIFVSHLEHSCVRETCLALEKGGRATLGWLSVDGDGRASLPGEGAPPGQPVLLCLMAVQNETGVLQPLEEAGEFRRKMGCLWLCDGVQSWGHHDLNPISIGADFLTLSSHKLNGPAGVGLLAGPGIGRIIPQITGGPQEGGLRAGTQPVAAIAGFVAAMRLAKEERGERSARLLALEQRLTAILGEIEGVRINGDGPARTPGFLNLSLPGLSAPDLVIAMDGRGVAVSAGSACATGVMEASPVLTAMFPNDRGRAASGIRITLGHGNTPDEVEQIGRSLLAVYASSRRKSVV